MCQNRRTHNSAQRISFWLPLIIVVVVVKHTQTKKTEPQKNNTRHGPSNNNFPPKQRTWLRMAIFWCRSAQQKNRAARRFFTHSLWVCLNITDPRGAPILAICWVFLRAPLARGSPMLIQGNGGLLQNNIVLKGRRNMKRR